MFERVLVATDLDDGMNRLGLCLQNFYDSGVKALNFVHAVPWGDRQVGGIPESHDPEILEAKQAIQQYIDPEVAKTTFEPTITAKVGKPGEILQRAIEEFKADVLILGPPGRSLLAEKMFGSTTMKLVQQLKIPILIMRPQLVASMTVAELQLRCGHLFDYLLVPCDLDSSRQRLLDMLSSLLCKQTKCEAVMLLAVIDTSSRRYSEKDSDNLSKKAEARLRELGAYLTDKVGHPLSIEYSVRKGAPVKEILSTAQDEDITAIATSSTNIGKIWELTVPSITGEILRRSWHSVLFFPPSFDPN